MERCEYQSYASAHYVFYFEAGSLAEKRVVDIAQEQERCFDRVCNALGVQFPKTIQYFLLDSPVKVGKLFGGDLPCNGFAVLGENKIYATYNDDVQCIGFHEDVHLISAAICIPKSEFLMEGLAMYFDETWWGIDNEIWAGYYKAKAGYSSVAEMLESRDFYVYDCMISYPVAGAFVKFMIGRYGMVRFLELYKHPGMEYATVFAEIFGATLEEIEEIFWDEMMKQNVDAGKLEAVLREALD